MGFRYVREYTYDRYPIVTQLRRASVSRHFGLFRRFEEDRLAFGVFRLSEATDSDGICPVPRLFRALAGYERACGTFERRDRCGQILSVRIQRLLFRGVDYPVLRAVARFDRVE